ncbi:KAP family NTPase [Mesorhizobium sp. ESP7-2]|uniref:P-loop NTPase fold protein n=1 Tax=Mesorhizobium sp. ESP7-2 TaxID=2876622 RepID=UPI001CCF3767|nr:P-loop NTPase fold protein [Mesorhizobium sp. ESP7-2]MBZ9709323.1 KAP family NTPase [Mesorhizobium sp. ESP7-2]
MPTVTVPNASDVVRRQIEPLLSNLFANASELGDYALSPVCAHILLECVRSLRAKRAEHDILSTTTVFLNTLLMARLLADTSPSAESYLSDGELGRLRAWGEIVNDGYATTLEAMADDFFRDTPTPTIRLFEQIPAAEQFIGVRFGPGMRQVLTSLSGAQQVHITDIIQQSFEDPKSGLSERRIENPDIGRLVDAIRGGGKTSAGRMPAMVREAYDDELALGVEKYAIGLATILRTAKGEFTFALFGPWGSGKTTLTRLLTPLLEFPEKFKKTIKLSEIPSADTHYDVVHHNAWKYRQPPEAWIYLYKSLVDRASAGMSTPAKAALAARTAHFRYGPWPLVGTLVALALLAIPLSATVQLATILGSLIGVGALAHIAAITPKVGTKIRTIFEKSARLGSTPERLGMLALVGEDIKALLLAWTTEPASASSSESQAPPAQGTARPAEPRPAARLIAPALVLLLVATGWIYGLIGQSKAPQSGLLITGFEFLSSFLPKGLIIRLGDLFVGPVESGGELGNWILLVAWIALAAVTLFGPWMLKEVTPNRVLLIIDDLDRCTPDEMLNVIENMKLLVDDPSISQRLQVLMLVDERVLAHAIAKRYEKMIEERAGEFPVATLTDAKFLASQEIVAEQSEKLFACHLRFPTLSDHDVADLVLRLSSRELDIIEQKQQQDQRARRAARLLTAEQDMKRAQSSQQAAEAVVQDVLTGKRRELVDVDAPSNRRLRGVPGMNDVGMEALPHEMRARTHQNSAAENWNRRVSGNTPEVRLAANPDVVRHRDQTAAEAKQAAETYRRLLAQTSEEDPGNAQADTPEPSFGAADVRFTRDEVGELERLVPGYFRTIGRRPSPRAIRILLFKIQLFRLLMQLRTPGRRLESLSMFGILQAFEEAFVGQSLYKLDDDIMTVAKQVI